MNPIKKLLKLIVAPHKGWEAISEEGGASVENLSSSILYPILGLFAIIVFFMEIEFTSQRSDSGIEKAIQYAVIAFVQFFSTFYIVAYIAKKIFKQYNTIRCNIYLVYLVTLTTLFYLIMTLFAEYVGYVSPLSLFVMYQAWIGYKYINPGAEKIDTKFVLLMSVMTLMFPLVISLLLRTLLTLI